MEFSRLYKKTTPPPAREEKPEPALPPRTQEQTEQEQPDIQPLEKRPVVARFSARIKPGAAAAPQTQPPQTQISQPAPKPHAAKGGFAAKTHLPDAHEQQPDETAKPQDIPQQAEPAPAAQPPENEPIQEQAAGPHVSFASKTRLTDFSALQKQEPISESAPAQVQPLPEKAPGPEKKPESIFLTKTQAEPAADHNRSSRLDEQTRTVRPDVNQPITAVFSPTDEVYLSTVRFTSDLIQTANSGQPVSLAQLRAQMKKFIAAIGQDPYRMLALSLDTPADNINSHSVNVALLAVFTGLRLGFSADELEILAYVSIFHDIAMPRFEGLISKDRKLESSEITEIQRHVPIGLEITAKVFGSEATMAQTINRFASLVHERVDGQGYPNRVKDDQIHIIGQIIGLSDVYEAMTHRRPWRDPMLPHLAMHHLVQQSGTAFRPKLVRFFIEHLTVFPPGCFLELSTGEIGQVIGLNECSITRPIVLILKSPSAEPGQAVNLLENPGIHVKRQIHRQDFNATV